VRHCDLKYGGDYRYQLGVPVLFYEERHPMELETKVVHDKLFERIDFSQLLFDSF
jgi:hypothetical protein